MGVGSRAGRVGRLAAVRGVAFLLTVLGPASAPREAPRSEPRPPPAAPGSTWHWPWLAALLVVLATLVLGGWAGVSQLHDRYVHAFASPDPLPEQGSIFLVFSQPCVEVDLRVVISEDPDATQTDLAVLVGQVGRTTSIPSEVDSVTGTPCDFTTAPEASSAPEDLEFALVFLGATRPPFVPMFPDGKTHLEDGCPWGMYPPPDATCDVVDVTPDGAPHGEEESALIVRGTIEWRDGRFVPTSLFTVLHRSYASTAGKRTVLRLPQVGTRYLPAEGRDLPLAYGPADPVYVPSYLYVAVEAEDLEITDRVEVIEPEPVAPSRLTWVEDDATTVEASAAWVDVTQEDATTRDVFILGAAMGLLGSITASLLGVLLRSLIRRLRTGGAQVK